MDSDAAPSNQATLQDRLAVLHQQGKAMPQREAMRVIHDVLRALAPSHQVGQAHRSVSAATVVRAGSGWRLLPSVECKEAPSADYLSPERIHGGKPSLRDDVYAVGKLMLALLAGGRAEVLSTLPDDLQEIIIKCTSPDPRWRYETAGTVLAALDGLSRTRIARGGRVFAKAFGGVAGLVTLIGISSIVVSLITGQPSALWPMELQRLSNTTRSANLVPVPTPVLAAARSGTTPADLPNYSTPDSGDQIQGPWNEGVSTSDGSFGQTGDQSTTQDSAATIVPGSNSGEINGSDPSSNGTVNGDESTRVDNSNAGQDPCTTKPGGLMFIEMGGAAPIQQASDQYAVDWNNEVLFTWQVPQSHTVHLRDATGTTLIDSRQSDSKSISVNKPRTFKAAILGCDSEEKVSREWQVTPLLRNLVVRTRLKIRDDENGEDEHFRSWEHPEWPAQQEIGFDEFHQHATLTADACAGGEVKVFFRYEFNLLSNGDIRVRPYMDIGEGTSCNPAVNNRRSFETFDLPGTPSNQTSVFVTRTYHLNAQPHDPSEAWLEVSLANELGTVRPARQP